MSGSGPDNAESPAAGPHGPAAQALDEPDEAENLYKISLYRE
jgi:hypothetical protein